TARVRDRYDGDGPAVHHVEQPVSQTAEVTYANARVDQGDRPGVGELGELEDRVGDVRQEHLGHTSGSMIAVPQDRGVELCSGRVEVQDLAHQRRRRARSSAMTS